jgi:ribosome recycling factor
MSYIDDNKDQYDKTVDFFKKDIDSLRTGRVAPSIVENIKIESYGVMTELMQLASITSPESHSIAIKPWDKNIIKDIEKALQNSDLNVNPVVDGELVRLNFPPLTEESRKDLVKILYKKLEESRIALRGQRDKLKDGIITLEKEKNISEDEKFQDLKTLDEVTKEYNDKLKEISDNKEKEIMTI